MKVLLHLIYSNLSKVYVRVRWGKMGRKRRSTAEKENTTHCPLEVIVGQECKNANPGEVLAFTRNQTFWMYTALFSLLPAFQLCSVAKTDL